MAASINGGVQDIIARLQQAGGRAVKAINDEMEVVMTLVQDQAKVYAPEDEGKLMDAIKLQNDGQRRKWSVYVDPNMPGSHGRMVGDYMTEMHEGSYVARKKGGPKFLTRAFDDAINAGLVADLQQKLAAAIAEAGIKR